MNLDSALGTIGAADVDVEGRRWWLGDNLGKVRPLAFDQLPQPVGSPRPLDY